MGVPESGEADLLSKHDVGEVRDRPVSAVVLAKENPSVPSSLVDDPHIVSLDIVDVQVKEEFIGFVCGASRLSGIGPFKRNFAGKDKPKGNGDAVFGGFMSAGNIHYIANGQDATPPLS